MKRIFLLFVWSLCTALSVHQVTAADSPYAAWQNHGVMMIITTPEGANLPASAVCEQFPLLVRLHRDWFDFAQAQKNGADIRFTDEAGAALPYQIESWDPTAGSASMWVRVPKIVGNTRQALHIHWGKADATSESNGRAVFNQANGYVGVWHLHGNVNDEVDDLPCTDNGTTSTAGIIGQARHFAGDHGISGGDKITTFPSGSHPHSTEVWIRPESGNSTAVGWGVETKQGKVVMQLVSPPTIRIDAYFSEANVSGNAPIAYGTWNQIVHTYARGSTHLYVNGQLDAAGKKGTALAIPEQAGIWIGGWRNRYGFFGDIDEVRISNVERSADWIKLQYENQKLPQTVVGHIVQSGNEFTVSKSEVTLLEGKSVTLSAQAGGAQKVYWVLNKAGAEQVIASDQFSCTVEAGRVSADQVVTVHCKAVYPQGVKTKTITINITEDIPDPDFTLAAPATWNGRSPIVVKPQITNAAAMQSKGAGKVSVAWFVDGMATIYKSSDEQLSLMRSQNSGQMTVRAELSNGGQVITKSVTIAVTEPQQDPWVAWQPAADEKPQDGQFYARDDKNVGTLYYAGSLDEQPELQQAESVFLKLYADDKLIDTISAKPKGDKSYHLAATLKPGLIIYKVEFGAVIGGKETVLRTVNDLVCGDAYIIEGQSNALATDTREESPPETNKWIRSYGLPKKKDADTDENLWCYPVWKARKGEKAELGWWGMELAKRLVASQKMPMCIINGAKGGTRIDQHQRNEDNPTDLETIYGRLLWRVQHARLTHGIRGILWHQGENNQGAASPTGDYDWKSYEQYFVDMSAGWKRDFPNVQHYYVFQIWPNACSMAGQSGCGDMIREIQRSLPRLYKHMSVMSTIGIDPPGGCHFPLAGWAEFARLIQPVIERDNYGLKVTTPITPANVQSVYYANATKDTIRIDFDQPVIWDPALISEFYLDGEAGFVVSGEAHGTSLTLKLKSPSTATQITYLKESNWSQERLLFGANGIAALTFCNVAIAEKSPLTK